jgi:hypothetical protein
MNQRCRLAWRNWAVSALAMGVTLSVASASHGFSWAWFTDAADATTKAKHTPITSLRSRMLENFHGQATNAFTAIPGFGMERMIPLYKQVPFEIPDFSTTEVEVEKEITPPKLLEDVFAKSLSEFRNPSKPLPVPEKKDFSPFGPGPKSGFGSAFGGTITRGLQLRLLDLVGLSDPDGPRVHSGGKAFEVMRMTFEEGKKERAKNSGAALEGGLPSNFGRPVTAKAPEVTAKLETRPLDIFEIAGVAELSQGKQLFVRHKDNVIRMLGALRATEQCLKCHTDNKKGDLLGAFSYTFVDVNKSLEKELKPSSAK